MSVKKLTELLAVPSEYDLEDLGEIVEEGEWEVDGKYESAHSVLRVDANEYDLAHGYYRIMFMRSGSYWTDYDYLDPHVTAVVPVEVTKVVTEWHKKEEIIG